MNRSPVCRRAAQTQTANRTHTHLRPILKLPVTLMRMDCGRKQEFPESPRRRREDRKVHTIKPHAPCCRATVLTTATSQCARIRGLKPTNKTYRLQKCTTCRVDYQTWGYFRNISVSSLVEMHRLLLLPARLCCITGKRNKTTSV